MTEFIINEDFKSMKDQTLVPLCGDGIIIRDGEQFLVNGETIMVYPGCTLINLQENTATIFLIKDKIHNRRKNETQYRNNHN